VESGEFAVPAVAGGEERPRTEPRTTPPEIYRNVVAKSQGRGRSGRVEEPSKRSAAVHGRGGIHRSSAVNLIKFTSTKYQTGVRRVGIMVRKSIFNGQLPQPIPLLENFIRASGTTLIRAAFANSFFVDPEKVRQRTPYFPGFVRSSKQHYPGQSRGAQAKWKGASVKIGDNARAQLAWAKYSGRKIERGSGYGVRHIWGFPWDPNAFTAGWNLCYMPFWVGILTEDQHPHPELQKTIQQASYDLFFKSNPVCAAPPYIRDHGINLTALLGDQTIQILGPSPRRAESIRATSAAGTTEEIIREIRSQYNASWLNLVKAVRELKGQDHDPFSTPNVKASSRTVVRRMCREADITLEVLGLILSDIAAKSKGQHR